MALGQLLDQVRDYYVSRFIEAINDLADGEDTLVHECAFRDGDGRIVSEGELDLPARTDAVVIRNGEAVDSHQIDTEGMLSFAPLAFDWPEGRLKVELNPFQWNWIQLRMHGVPAETDWKRLREWFLRWFGDEDPADDELLGGVHFMSDPDSIAAYFQVSLDCGTAPVESFEELLETVSQMGVNRLEVGQFNASA